MNDRRREERLALVGAIAEATTNDQLLAVQEQMAGMIADAEAALRAGHDADWENHADRVRLLGDGIAWHEIHPHALRQFAKLYTGSPTPILGQGRGFETALEVARKIAGTTVTAVLLCDVTYLLAVGDIIVCEDPETPRVIEVKTTLKRRIRQFRGRAGRQVKRATSVVSYLHRGRGVVAGNPALQVSTAHRATRGWTLVEDLTDRALQSGFAREDVRPGEVIWAYVPGRAKRCVREAVSYDENHPDLGSAQFGTTSGLMSMRDGLYAPPGAWPLPPSARFALNEGEVELAHLAYGSLLNVNDRNVSVRFEPGAQDPVVIETEGRTYPLSRRFLYDVVYGFETVESVREGLVEFGEALHAVVEELGAPPALADSKPWIADEGQIALDDWEGVAGLVITSAEGKSRLIASSDEGDSD